MRWSEIEGLEREINGLEGEKVDSEKKVIMVMVMISVGSKLSWLRLEIWLDSIQIHLIRI